jgi:hypothetical protein
MGGVAFSWGVQRKGNVFLSFINWSAWMNWPGQERGNRKMRCGGTTFLPRGVECLMMTNLNIFFRTINSYLLLLFSLLFAFVLAGDRVGEGGRGKVFFIDFLRFYLLMIRASGLEWVGLEGEEEGGG